MVDVWGGSEDDQKVVGIFMTDLLSLVVALQGCCIRGVENKQKNVTVALSCSY